MAVPALQRFLAILLQTPLTVVQDAEHDPLTQDWLLGQEIPDAVLVCEEEPLQVPPQDSVQVFERVRVCVKVVPEVSVERAGLQLLQLPQVQLTGEQFGTQLPFVQV